MVRLTHSAASVWRCLDVLSWSTTASRSCSGLTWDDWMPSSQQSHQYMLTLAEHLELLTAATGHIQLTIIRIEMRWQTVLLRYVANVTVNSDDGKFGLLLVCFERKIVWHVLRFLWLNENILASNESHIVDRHFYYCEMPKNSLVCIYRSVTGWMWPTGGSVISIIAGL